jgi:hypothetical protein
MAQKGLKQKIVDAWRVDDDIARAWDLLRVNAEIAEDDGQTVSARDLVNTLLNMYPGGFVISPDHIVYPVIKVLQYNPAVRQGQIRIAKTLNEQTWLDIIQGGTSEE